MKTTTATDARIDDAQTVHLREPAIARAVDPVVNRFYPNLLQPVHACLAVFGAMALKGRTKPLSLIFETASGYGKTACLQMVFPTDGSPVKNHVYRSDKFTPKAFVSHAANVPSNQVEERDLLPKLENKVLVTKELAPIFRGREEELQSNFSVLISVLDGKGFTSDSGMRGQRGYEKPLLFNWIGATTPLPATTHRLMAQLGTRLLFYEVPAVEPTEDQLMEYAEKDDAGEAEIECQKAVNWFLADFFSRHPVGTYPADDLVIPTEILRQIVRWAGLLAHGRAEIKFEKVAGQDWTPVAVGTPEGPFKIVNYLKEIARGHALIHDRTVVNEADLGLVIEVALSSLPGHLRPIVRQLRKHGCAETGECARLCHVSGPTVRKYFKELDLLGLAALTEGSAPTNQPHRLTLATQYHWMLNLENKV